MVSKYIYPANDSESHSPWEVLDVVDGTVTVGEVLEDITNTPLVGKSGYVITGGKLYIDLKNKDWQGLLENSRRSLQSATDYMRN